MLLDAVNLMVEKERRSAEYHAEDGHPAEGNRNAHYPRALDGFEHEQAEDTVHEIKQTNDVLRRREVSPARVEQCRLRGKFCEEEGGKADQAAPDHPADALIIFGRLSSPPYHQDGECTRSDNKAGEDACPGACLRPVAKRISIGS